MTLTYNELFINGRWVQPNAENTITVRSANTGEVVGQVVEANTADVDAAVDAAHRAFQDPDGWSTWEPARRAAAMESLAVALEARAEEMGRRVSTQNGMPIAISPRLEGGYPVTVLRYTAALLSDFEQEVTRPHLFGGETTVRRDPLGVVAAIAPWNFPQTLASFKYAPALAAGCTLVIKPSRETVLDSMLFAEAVAESEIPAGVINIVPGGGVVGNHLVAHPDVAKVAFTGSTRIGRQIAETCGRLLRPVSLELGGKSAAIILDDADLDLATIGPDLLRATMTNNGQTCYLGTRILAPRRRYDDVIDAFTSLIESVSVGDSLDPGTQVGPMASESHRDRVEQYIAKGTAEGARLITGGGRPDGLKDGWFVQPTIFADVDNSSTIAQEEIFGPVLSIIAYDEDDDAVRIANDSDYGLAGTVWTGDKGRGERVARRVQTGTIGVNRYAVDPAAPFGGIKDSGLGRELGPDSLNPYFQIKSIYT
jgi:aldehyde dehydrogenase (NAD+)